MFDFCLEVSIGTFTYGTSAVSGVPYLKMRPPPGWDTRGLCSITRGPRFMHAITRQQGLDLRALLRQHFRVERPDALTLPQASHLIDQLKSTEEPPTAA